MRRLSHIAIGVLLVAGSMFIARSVTGSFEPGVKRASAREARVALPLIPAPDDRRASFSVKVKDFAVPYGVMGLFVMPEEEVPFETPVERPDGAYTLSADAGSVERNVDGEWVWKAPQAPGSYRLVVQGPVDAITFHALVMTPFRNGEPVLNQYRIGQYQSRPLRGNARFLPPQGMIEVNDQTASVRVSPNFTLGAFASHQPGQPRYMALDERLIIKLELLLEELQTGGMEVSTFTVMSGFRTPWYNASIGNTTRYSLHLYGRGADIFIDEDGNGRMDDLDGNGREDRGDALYLADFINDLREDAWYQPFLGGLGIYGPKPHRGPFVHVDVRGHVARW